jgi:hypothetical protein
MSLLKLYIQAIMCSHYASHSRVRQQYHFITLRLALAALQFEKMLQLGEDMAGVAMKTPQLLHTVASKLNGI